MEYEEALQRIISDLDAGNKTDIEDWEVIFGPLSRFSTN